MPPQQIKPPAPKKAPVPTPVRPAPAPSKVGGIVPDRIDKSVIQKAVTPAKVTPPVKPAKPSTPAGPGMHWEYNASSNKWVKVKNAAAPAATAGPAAPAAGGQGFEFGGLPSIDFSNVDLTGTMPSLPEPTIPTGPSQAEIDAENARRAAEAAAAQQKRQADADRFAREGLSASAAAILAGVTGQELADITTQERSGNLDLAAALEEAASGRRAAALSTRAEQNRAAYEGAVARQRAAAEMAARGFGGAGVGTYQRMVMQRQTGQQLSDAESRLASALSAFDRMKQQAQARRDAAQANLLARINPVAQFTRGGA